MGGETQYISQHNTLYPHCGMGGETQYISQYNTLDPHCGMGGRHNIFPNTIHWIHIAEFPQSPHFQNDPASSSQNTAPLGSSLGLSLSSSDLGPTTFSLNPPAPTAFMGSSNISLTSAPWSAACSAVRYPSLQ